MFTFYDVEVFKHDWLVVFEQDGQFTRIHNDWEALRGFLNTVHFLIGFNNYHYDDKVIAGILRGMDPYEVSSKIIAGDEVRLFLNKPITLDVMQEMRMGVGLKEAEANLGLNVHETPVDFALDRSLTPEEIEQTFLYCENDVKVTKHLFGKRESYFASKFELVKTFSLPASAVKRTRAGLSATVLKCGKFEPPADRLYLQYDHRLPLDELPKDVTDFYKKIEHEYRSGGDPEELEKRKLEIDIAGVPHTFGFGGLHGARENFVYSGKMMIIDVSSFYPTIMINNGFVSRASREPELFKQIYHERLRLKGLKDPKQEVYKIVLNATFGASKSEFNPLYDPRQANNICVNGQLILTHLILSIEPFCKLIQSNTDGIIISYENDDMRDIILEGLDTFEKYYNLSFDVGYIKKIAQRDVNNYVIQYEDGKIEAKGRFAHFDGGNFERNNLHIIDKALVNHYIYNIPIQRTVVDCFKKNELGWFQIIAKAGNTFKGIVHEVDGQMIELQKINRIFATNDKRFGAVYKTKEVDGTIRYNKIPMTSDNMIVHNESIETMDRRKIDLNYYIRLIKSNLFA